MKNRSKSPIITYRLRLFDPAAHLFEVTLEIQNPPPSVARDGLLLTLPAWIPGSYMIREFARHIVAIDARCDGRPLALTKQDKHSWQTAAAHADITVIYRVYAWDLSVRTAHFDDSHAFFNGSSVFLRIPDLADQPCLIDIEAPSHLPEHSSLRRARVATTLPRNGAKRWGFGGYRANGYDELIDHPVEIGEFSLYAFKACGVPHHVVLSGRHDCDGKRLIADIKPICEAQIRLFEPRRETAPFAEYLFLTQAVGDGYGGLEHRASTALICTRNDLPYPGMTQSTDGYRRFLGLVSHEYFHSWNVKRIKPAAFAPYDLYRENYTRLLWIFEGFTSYYDDLMLARSGVTSADQYLGALGNTISSVLRSPGRLQQSVAESSFEAWTKYYRQDEQSPNSIISYYTKGAMVALAIDLSLRQRTQGKRSLDDVMRALWVHFGRDFEQHQRGLGEHEFSALLEQATGVDLSAKIRSWSEGTRDIELAELLGPFGIDFVSAPNDANAWLGARLINRQGELCIATVYSGGPAHTAGLAAGDVLIALDGLKLDDASLKAQLARRNPGGRAQVHAFRRDELREFSLRFSRAPATEAKLSVRPTLLKTQKQLLRGWLSQVAIRRSATG
jgi:predicted metalloprotease with PDZ domain